MAKLLRRCGLTGATAALLLALPAPVRAAGSPIPAAEILARVQAGRPVVLAHETIVGRLDLARITDVHGVFKCRECRFLGHVDAGDVTFEHTVDVTGSTFSHGADFRGATFHAPALFRAAFGDNPDTEGRPLVVHGRTDFSLAVFEDIASFSGATFTGTAAFGDARFLDVSFARAEFSAMAGFARTSFRGIANFNGTFFDESATFDDADFRARTDFAVSVFGRGATFSGAQFASGASFLAAEFNAPKSGEEDAASFDSVTSAGNLDFTFTDFKSPARKPQEIAVFDDLVCGKSLVFRTTGFPPDDSISMTRLQVTDLVLDVATVRQVAPGDNGSDQESVLRTIENSAKTRDELGVANDAHYELRVRASKRYGATLHALDYVFYRGAAGYFVKPFRPLLLLGAIATLAAMARYLRIRTKPEIDSSRGRLRIRWRAAQVRCADFLTCLLDTFALAAPRWRSTREGDVGLGERVQAILYRLLLVCALLGLANSNPTLRNMVDTLV